MRQAKGWELGPLCERACKEALADEAQRHEPMGGRTDLLREVSPLLGSSLLSILSTLGIPPVSTTSPGRVGNLRSECLFKLLSPVHIKTRRLSIAHNFRSDEKWKRKSM